MDTIISEEAIREDLIRSFQYFFGINVRSSTPIKRGWLNLKWRLTTDSGHFLIKQYNKERYKLYHPEELQFALSQQERLRELGLPCPLLLSCNDRILLESDHGETFMAMEYCQGSILQPGTINAQQMHDLGRATGKMHRLLNDGTIDRKKQPKFIPPSREERLAHWNSLMQQAKDKGKYSLLADMEIQRSAAEEIDLEVLSNLETGWVHRDLWVDNLLFHEDRLSAILDFDRLDYDYPQLDVARAIMSCALNDHLNVDLISAFAAGYTDEEQQSLPQGYVAQSLQLLWYLESTWWVHANMDEHSVPPARFAKEMNWLAINLKKLPEILGDL
ncbi:phosphotransferase [Neobacillus mesonae]|nr:phosphotransferase [Neobacillus mesonae]